MEFSREAVVVNDGATYGVPILPESAQQLNRVIEVHKRASLKGPIFGKMVSIDSDSYVGEWVFGEESVVLEAKATVQGNVISTGTVELSDSCQVGSADKTGNIIADDVVIAPGCTVHGNVLGRSSVEIKGRVVVDGIVCCLGGELKLGSGVTCRDVIGGGRVSLPQELKVKDHVIWSMQALVPGGTDDGLEGIVLGGLKPRAANLKAVEGGWEEVNMNYDRVTKVDPKAFEVEPDVLSEVAAVLRARAEPRPD